MGVVRVFGLDQGQATSYIVAFAVVVSLIATLFSRKGSLNPFYGVCGIGIFSFSHLLTLDFSPPGLIMLGFNLFFWASSSWLLRKAAFSSRDLRINSNSTG